MTNSVFFTQLESALKENNFNEAARLIQLGVRQKIDFQGRHVFCANVLFASMPWREVSALLPSGTNSFQTTGWLNSVLKGRPVDVNDNPIPWFTYPAIDFLESILNPDWRVFEWGSGNSTKWWAKKCAFVTAVESNTSWHAEVSRSLPPNAKVILAEDQESYTQAIRQAAESVFDIVVVDGDHRNQCASMCLDTLSDDGIVVFDNSDRHVYNEGIQCLLNAGFFRIDFWGLIPSYAYRNCTSIFFRNPELLNRSPLPSEHVSNLGLSCEQSIALLKAKIKI
jgi:hypothetical protein